MQKSRLLYSGKNIIWGYVSSFVTIVLSFVTRTAFLATIGIEYLGINGLFSNVLGVLSLTELGIGTAMTYSLYKPVAENNIEKIKSLMQVYKNAYRIVALVVTLMGVAILPFINFLVKGADGIEHVKLYYLIFLFNTVSSYFVSYKYGLVSADQKNYIITNITTITNVATNVIQIVMLIVFKSYIVYLVTQAVILLSQKIFTFFYIDRKYPYLTEKNIQPLEKKEKNRLIVNIKALICHKIGDVSVNQTDNIIISAFVNVTTVGLISNYQLITNTISILFNNLFNGMTGSLGNLFATESKEKQYQVFKTIDLCAYWVYAYSTIMIFSLVQPFIALMWGEQYLIDVDILIVFLVNYYMVGQRLAIYNIKVAGGIFDQDKFLAIIQSIINLVVSVVLVKMMGTLGVFIGTIIAGCIPSLIRPYIIFRDLLNRSSKEYYFSHFKRLVLLLAIGGISYYTSSVLIHSIGWVTWFIIAIIYTIIVNTILWLIYRKTNEYCYIKSAFIVILHKVFKKSKRI